MINREKAVPKPQTKKKMAKNVLPSVFSTLVPNVHNKNTSTPTETILESTNIKVNGCQSWKWSPTNISFGENRTRLSNIQSFNGAENSPRR